MEAKDIKKYWDGVEWDYRDWPEGRGPRIEDFVIDILGEIPGKRILDLGCGTATLAIELAKRGYDAVGMDISLKGARGNPKLKEVNVELIEQNMAELDFENEFDAIVNWDIAGIGIFPTDEENVDVIKRIARALKPGGKFLIETYHYPFALENGVEKLKFDPASGRFVGRYDQTAADGSITEWELSVRFFSPEEWRSIFAQAGLEFLGEWGGRDKRPINDECSIYWALGRKN